MPTAAELGDAFYSGSLFGRTPDAQRAFYGQAASFLNKKGSSQSLGTGGSIFNQEAFEAATKAGYSSNDINAFLRDSGVKAEGSMFQVAGLGEYGGKQDTYWQVTPSYKPPTPAPAASTTTIPNTANKVLETIQLPNNGLATIESVKPLPPSVSAPAPVLGDPLGESSQRVQRQKARLSIAK